MSYLVLARKWRPRKFSEMAGQEHVVKALKNALDSGRLHHAYLFSGTRGVGKTTVARIFAKALQCEKGTGSNPCGECRTCVEIDSGRYIDVIEVDAASRTKVEDTRDLLENVQYTPTLGRFKIYIIDEVHMLSTHSFNALLKTLEEPPAHVKFLLATTDPQKLPVTVLSRCLQFNLKALPPDLIFQQMLQILQAENIDYEEPALYAIAKAAQGSVRDALSILDQAISFCDGKIGSEQVMLMLGNLGQTFLLQMVDGLLQKDGAAILQITQQAAEISADFHKVLHDLIDVFHRLAVVQVLGKAPSDLAEWLEILPYREKISAEDVQLFYQIGLFGLKDMAIAQDARTAFEMILLRMLAFQPLTPDDATLMPPARVSAVQSAPVVKMTPPSLVTTPSSAVSESQAKDGEDELQLFWTELLNKMELSALTKQLAQHCVLQRKSDTRLELALAPDKKNFLTKQMEDHLQFAVRAQLGAQINLTIKIMDHGVVTIAERIQRKNAQIKQAATDAILNDQVVNDMIKTFDAQLATDSIKPKK